MRKYLIGILCLLAAPAVGQNLDPPGDVIPLAVTICHDTVLHGPDSADSASARVRAFSVTMVDVRALGADSTEEILLHERVHMRQNRDSLRLVGHCPGPWKDPRGLLRREIEAYCASDSVRILRTHDIREAGVVSVWRLQDQLGDRIPLSEIAWQWKRYCPSFSFGVEIRP